MTKGRLNEAKQSLIRLRGNKNMDIVDNEFNRIAQSIQIAENNAKLVTKRLISNIPTDSSFWKPFGFLMALFIFGNAWTGIPPIGFYMVPLLIKSKIPIDPYFASAILGIYRY